MKSVPSDGCGGDKSASGGIHIREARTMGWMTGRHFKKSGDVVGMVFSDLFGDRKLWSSVSTILVDQFVPSPASNEAILPIKTPKLQHDNLHNFPGG